MGPRGLGVVFFSGGGGGVPRGQRSAEGPPPPPALTDPRPSCSMVRRRSETGERSAGKRDLTTAGEAGEAGERSRRRRR